jgi:hypothetical protein
MAAPREIAEWSVTDASNNFPADEGGWVEGMPRSDVNDAARADMGALRRWYDDPEWLDLTVGATLVKDSAFVLRVQSGNFTSYFTEGRRVKITGGAQDPVYATVVSSSFATDPDTTVTLNQFDGHTEIPVGPGQVYLHITSSISSNTFLDDIFVRVTELTDVAIQAAVDALEAANGGIIVLEPKATYVISNTITIGTGVSEGNIRIMGRGATLQAAAALDGDETILIYDGGATVDANVIIDEVIFDGNSSAMTVSSANVGMLEIGTDISYVWVRNCHFTDSYGYCIRIRVESHKIWISDTTFSLMGQNGIEMDASNNTDEVYISRCSFTTPANRVSTGSCIHFVGRCHISDCDFHLDHASNVEIGVHAAEKGSASPSDESGRESSIVGCRFEGSGANARGVYVQGRDNTISACSFYLSGVSSEGVRAEMVTHLCDRNVVTGCHFVDGNRAVRLEATTNDWVVVGNTFDLCTYPYTDDGDRNIFQSNVCDAGTDGVTISSSAHHAVVSGNNIHNMDGGAISVVSGANDTQLLHNYTQAIASFHVSDAGTRTAELSGFRASYLEKNLAVAGSQNGFSAEVLATNGAGEDFLTSFAEFADSVRIWVVEFSTVIGQWGSLDSTPGNVIFRLRYGTNSGTPGSDTEIVRNVIPTSDGVVNGDFFTCVFPQVEFTPGFGDDIYLTVNCATSTDIDWAATDTNYHSYFRVRPK